MESDYNFMESYFELNFTIEELNLTDYNFLQMRYLDPNLTMYTPADFDIMKQPGWIAAMVTLYITVIVLGVIGNGFIIYVVLRLRYMKTVTNIFICNLALADIGLCLFNLPFQLHYQLTNTWIFGDALCHITFATFGVPVYVSTLTFLLIAFDRYYLIVFPLKTHIKMRTAILLLAAIAFFSLGLAIPLVVFTKTKHVVEPLLKLDTVYCIEDWPSFNQKMIYSCGMFLCEFCFPLLISCGLYRKLYERLLQRPLGIRDAQRNQRRRRTCKILVAIVSVFVICWLPWSAFTIIVDFKPTVVQGKYFTFLDLLLKLFAMSSACINPFLYGWLNENFRKEIDIMLGRAKRGSGHVFESSTTAERLDIHNQRMSRLASVFSSKRKKASTNSNGLDTELLQTSQKLTDTGSSSPDSNSEQNVLTAITESRENQANVLCKDYESEAQT